MLVTLVKLPFVILTDHVNIFIPISTFAVYKHLRESAACLAANDEQSFSLLDSAPTPYQLSIKEALYIAKIEPVLNKQKKTMKVELRL